MKIIRYLMMGSAFIVAFILITPLFLGNRYESESSIEIKEDKASVYSFVLDLNNFNRWNPWYALDTAAAYVVTGESGTIGSSFSWKGNEEVGEGEIILIDRSENELTFEQKFYEPYETTSPMHISISELKEGTLVTWSLTGQMDYPTNLALLFTDMGKEMEPHLEKGLASLKKELEAR